jgi:hypothetical protein
MAAEEAIEAIFRAAREGDAVSVARMLDEKPRLIFSVRKNRTLLTRAVWDGHVGLVRLVLDRGAEVNHAAAHGSTALHFAAFIGPEEVVSALLSSGADPTRKGSRGHTALMCASIKGYVPVVQLLLRSLGAHGLDERNEDGVTALWFSCRSGHADVVRALLLAGADHTIVDNNDTTPLQIAQEAQHDKCAALLQVSTSLVSRSQGHHDGTVCAVCGARVVWGRTSQSVPVLRWWEGELQRAYVVHKARTLHDDTATLQQGPAAPVPAYLRARLPHVQIQGSDGSGGRRTRGAAKRIAERGGEDKDEEVCAMVGFVVKDLSAELYIELLAGFHQ